MFLFSTVIEVKDVKIPDFKQEIQPRSLRGSDDYAKWVKNMQSTIAPINDQQISNLLVACLYYLGVCYLTRIIFRFS